MKKIMIYFVLIALFFTGCSNDRKTPEYTTIDWVDFIKVNGISYVSDYDQTGLRIDKTQVDEEYSVIKYKVSDNVHNPSYKTQDGDAAFLDIGTKIYKLKDYSPDFRLVVYTNEEIKIYEADYNMNAKKGEDLLDIKDKVEYIDVDLEDEKGTTKKYKIDDTDKVKKLVNYIMESKIDYNMRYSGGDRYFLYFYLIDGTRIRKCYFVNDNFLNHGIVLPESFKDEFLSSIE